jgi:hypothetical protein
VMARRYLDGLPTLGEVQAARRAAPKPGPRVLRRQQRQADLKAQEDAFRKAVWRRDGRTSRASGKPLVKAHLDPDKRGEVAHLVKRSRAPGRDDKFNPDRAVLLSATEHALSDARTAPGGQVLLEIVGDNGAADVLFIRRDATGQEVWRRVSRPPGR